eukprot:scaffold111808_cov54-Phaeocystis_antarctica.AAC.1
MRLTVTFGPEWLRVARTACSPRGLGTSLVTACGLERVRATPGGRCPRGARARRHGLCGEPAYAGLRRTRSGGGPHALAPRVERVNGPVGEPKSPYKNPPHTSVLVRGVRQRRRAPQRGVV